MPPSGFSQKAINGLLEFVSANYRSVLSEYKAENNGAESTFLTTTSNELEQRVGEAIKQCTPLEIDEQGIRGLVTFVTSCYRDLVKEIQDGKDKYDRPVFEGKAMQKEIKQIEDYLTKFKL